MKEIDIKQKRVEPVYVHTGGRNLTRSEPGLPLVIFKESRHEARAHLDIPYSVFKMSCTV